MPTVALLEPQVAPAPLPGPRLQGVTPEQLGSIGAQQTQQVGAAASDLFQEQVALQNQVRVNDALNQARQKALDLTYGDQGYLGLQGRNALDRPDGQALPDEYGGQLSSAINDIGSTLTPQQQRVFNLQAADLQTSFRGDVQKHMLTQSRAYAMSVQDSTQKLAGDTAAQHWDDPTAINGGIDANGNEVPGLVRQAQAAVYASSKLTGMDAQAAIFDAGSQIHARVIQAALENGNPIYATQYLQQHSKDMTSDDILRVQARVNSAADTSMSQLATNQAMATLRPAAAPSDMDRLSNLASVVAQQESGGRETNPDGSTVTSSAGAKGVMQVLDSTAANPGHGINAALRLPDGSFDPADRARVGRQLLGALVQKYGNVPQALAAYNAGEGNVDKAIADAKSVGEPGLWLQALGDHQSEANHAQTVAYIASIMPKFEAGAGAAPMPTKEQFVQSALDVLGPNARPTAMALTRQQAEARYTLMIQSRDEQGDQALRAGQQAIIANGGDFVAWQQQNPDQVAALRQWAPGKMDDLALFAKHINRGENTTNLAAYGAAVTHPEELAQLSDAAMDQFVKTNMSVADGEKLYRLRKDYMSGTADQGINSLNQAALTAKLSKSLMDLGLDPSAKDLPTRTRMGDIQQTLSDGILAQQRQQNRKFAAADIDAYVDQQVGRGTVVEHWYGDKQVPVLATQFSDAPSDVQDKIKNSFAVRGVKNPTDGQLTRAWLAWKQANADAPPSK